MNQTWPTRALNKGKFEREFEISMQRERDRDEGGERGVGDHNMGMGQYKLLIPRADPVDLLQ